LSPGAPFVGQIDIQGNVTFGPTSSYGCEIGNTNDRVDIAGTATINGGTLALSAVDVHQGGPVMTVLTATGGITGKFAQTAPQMLSATEWIATIYEPNAIKVVVAKP